MLAKQLQCVYIAPLDRVEELKGELKDIVFEKHNFFIAGGAIQEVYWAQNIWLNCQVENIESIKKAATFLRSIQKRWWPFPLAFVRRSQLISEHLAKIKNEPLGFPTQLSDVALGAFALLSESEMIYAPQCLSKQPNGEFLFKEPSYATPSGAYLKLWEALVRLGAWPKAEDHCVDLGSSPGSWTQALLALGAQVSSFDRAELSIGTSPRLKFFKKDAFKIDPLSLPEPQWVFSDLICYPEKLYELALSWKRAYPQAKFVFTIKFQGKWDPNWVKKFCEIENSTVCHLFNNKHELCWVSGPSLMRL